jgi:hypothetical protein
MTPGSAPETHPRTAVSALASSAFLLRIPR